MSRLKKQRAIVIGMVVASWIVESHNSRIHDIVLCLVRQFFGGIVCVACFLA